MKPVSAAHEEGPRVFLALENGINERCNNVDKGADWPLSSREDGVLWPWEAFPAEEPCIEN